MARPPTQTAANNVRRGRQEGLRGIIAKRGVAPPTDSSYDLGNPPAIPSQTLERLRTAIDEIPPLPEMWHRVQEIMQRPDGTASDLGRCIEEDPLLSAHIIKVSNSPAYSDRMGKQITNVVLAVARLGMDEVGQLLFRILAPKLGESDEYSAAETRSIWFHSRAISVLTRLLIEPSRLIDRNQASLFGMLHDIGKLVVLHIEPAAKLKALKAAIDKGVPSLQAEWEVLGYTHIDAGMMLALHWHFPKSLQNIIALHYHPEYFGLEALEAEIRPQLMAIQTAHLVLQEYAEGGDCIWSGELWHYPPGFEYWLEDELRLSVESDGFLAQLRKEVERLKSLFPDLFPSDAPAD